MWNGGSMKDFYNILLFAITFIVLIILMVGTFEYNLPSIPREIDYI